MNIEEKCILMSQDGGWLHRDLLFKGPEKQGRVRQGKAKKEGLHTYIVEHHYEFVACGAG